MQMPLMARCGPRPAASVTSTHAEAVPAVGGRSCYATLLFILVSLHLALKNHN